MPYWDYGYENEADYQRSLEADRRNQEKHAAFVLGEERRRALETAQLLAQNQREANSHQQSEYERGQARQRKSRRDESYKQSHPNQREARHGFRGLAHNIGRGYQQLQKYVLPIAGSILGGPIGGALGGALGNAVQSHRNVGRNLLRGAGTGALMGVALPYAGAGLGSLGSTLGGSIGSGMGSLGSILGANGGVGGGIFGAGSMLPGLGGAAGAGAGAAPAANSIAHSTYGSLAGTGAKGMGMGAAAGSGMGGYGNLAGMGAMSMMGNGKQQPGPASPSQGGGIMDTLSDWTGGLIKSPLDALLAGTGLYGAFAGKEKPGHQLSLDEVLARQGKHGHSGPSRKAKTKGRKRVDKDMEEYNPYKEFTPQNFYEEVNPNEEGQYYARGGYVRGAAGGQADNIKTKLRPNSYVMDSTTVSLAGDGNSDNGALRIRKEAVDHFTKSGIYKSEHHHGKPIPAYISEGEMVLEPEEVTAIGRGDNKLGIKRLDKFRNNLRTHKGVKKFLPPKSKPLIHYFG